jgi:hypothetical protein
MVPNWLLLHLHKLQKKGKKLSTNNEKLLRNNAKRLERLLYIKEWNWGMRMERDERLSNAELAHRRLLVEAWEKSTQHLPRCCICKDQDWPRCDGKLGCNFVAKIGNNKAFKTAIADYHQLMNVINSDYNAKIADALQFYSKWRLH